MKYYHNYTVNGITFECTIEAEPPIHCQIRDERGGLEPDYAAEIYVTKVKIKGIDILELVADDVLNHITEEFISCNNSF